jgi:GMP synthase-like glutamine amidotransferase
MMRRIAVLTTVEGLPPFALRHPDDGAKVAAGLKPLRAEWQFDTWRVSENQWPADVTTYDGVVITGSPASVNDDSAWIRQLEQVVRDLHARSRPIVGICFGHQVIATALGGRVAASASGLRIGTATTRFTAHAAWMQPAQAAVTLYAAHEDQVVEPPAEATVLGGDEVCPVAAYAIGATVFATQCHPELSRAFMDDVLAAMGPMLTPDALQRGLRQVQQPVDAPLMMRWIAQFFDQAFDR